MRIFTRMFRSVNWTHDMIIVKWHLFIWHKRKLCAVTNAPPVQSTQRGQWLSTLFHFVYLMMTNVMVKTCLNQKIIKNSNLIQAMKNNVCPKATVIRRPNFSKNSPNVPKCRLNTRYDNREVTWSDSYSIFPKAELVRIFTECSEVWFYTRHDNSEATLIHLTRAQTLRSDKCATGSIHANGSMTIDVIPC